MTPSKRAERENDNQVKTPQRLLFTKSDTESAVKKQIRGMILHKMKQDLKIVLGLPDKFKGKLGKGMTKSHRI